MSLIVFFFFFCNVYLFVCLFACLFACLLLFLHTRGVGDEI